MHLSQWAFLDFVFGGIVLISTALALTKGLVREIISTLALVGGFVLAAMYYPIVARGLVEFSRTESIADLIGFMVIFFGCLLVGALSALLTKRFIKATSLQWIDRLLGGALGFVRGWAVASILVLALVAFPVRENLLARSVLAPYMLASARTAVILVPQGLKEKFNQRYTKVLHALNQNRSVV